MSIQERIRKEAETHIRACLKVSGIEKDIADSLSKSLMVLLHGLDLMIKVDKELPIRNWYNDWGGESGKAGYELAMKDMAGYEAVEPLIKVEVKDGENS